MIGILLLMLSGLLTLALTQTHPLAFSLVLLFLSLTVSLQLILSTTVWMGLGLALIFMGGMMVIILYVSALIGESKFFSSQPLAFLSILLPLSLSAPLSSTSLFQAQLPLFSFYLSLSVFALGFLTLYLLLTLVLAVVISEAHDGPVTQWN